MSSSDVVSRVIISKKVFWDCGGFRDIRCVVNWSAVSVEAVFESSSGFTYVLFGAVVAMSMWLVTGMCMKFVRQIYIYKWDSFLPMGISAARLVVLCDIAKFGPN